ncbi:MAG: MFS transporter [Deltaproteobacteria bacterium]|nr:MFS transporter [Deltaproteobacteria bacterium]
MPDIKFPKVFYGWWIVLVAVMCTTIIVGSSTYSFSLFVKPLQAHFGWNRADIMAAFTIMFLVSASLSPLVGRLADLFGPKRVVVTGALISSSAFVSLSFTNGALSFYLSYAVLGVGVVSMGQLPLSVVISNWFEKRRGQAVGMMASGIGFGGIVIVPIMGGYVIPNLGWRNSYLVLSSLTFVIIPLVIAVIKEKPVDMGLLPDGDMVEKSQNPAHSPLSTRKDYTLAMAIKSPAFWMIACTFMLSQFGVMGTMQSQVPYFEDIGFPVHLAATILGITGFLSAISKIFFGWLCDRINPKYACIIGVALQAIGTSILLQMKADSSVIFLLGFIIIFGLGAGSWMPIMSMLVSTTFGLQSYGAIFGMVNVALYAGASSGPLSAGYIYDITNTYFWAFTGFICLYIISIFTVILVRKPRQRS